MIEEPNYQSNGQKGVNIIGGFQSNNSGRPQTRGRSSGTTVVNTRGQSRGMRNNKMNNNEFPKEPMMQINEFDTPVHQSSYQT